MFTGDSLACTSLHSLHHLVLTNIWSIPRGLALFQNVIFMSLFSFLADLQFWHRSNFSPIIPCYMHMSITTLIIKFSSKTSHPFEIVKVHFHQDNYFRTWIYKLQTVLMLGTHWNIRHELDCNPPWSTMNPCVHYRARNPSTWILIPQVHIPLHWPRGVWFDLNQMKFSNDCHRLHPAW